jgi:hypothetical protein
MEGGKQEMASGSGLVTTVGDMTIHTREVAAFPAGGGCAEHAIDGGALGWSGLVEQDA